MSERRIKFWFLGAVFVTACSVLFNYGDASYGAAVTVTHQITTVAYIVFWTALPFFTWQSKRFTRVFLVFSALNFLSSMGCLLWGWKIIPLLAMFSFTSMYGLRAYMNWTQMYAVSTILYFFWLVCALVNTFKLRR